MFCDTLFRREGSSAEPSVSVAPAFDYVRCLAIVWLVVYQVTVSAESPQILFPGATWETANPESVWVDSEKLNAAVRTLSNPDETMVIQNGRVIWQGNNVDSQQHVWSVTKTYASTAMGLLFDDGALTLDTLVSDFVPAMETSYPDATFRHFVTQTSGYVAAGETIPLGLPEPEDPYAPGEPMFSPSGSQFAYTGAAMDMFAYALSLAAEQPLQDLFSSRIAGPIKMDADTWEWLGFETHDGVQVDGGSGYSDKGMAISAANAARLGLLFLARGKWDGEQLLSADWIDLATQVQVSSSLPLHSDSATQGPGVYGLGWWVASSGWFEAIGFENNYLSVNPNTGMVVVSLGTESGGNGNIDSFKSMLGRAAIPAVWDGLGDGNWDEIDASGKSRWTTEDGLTAVVFPTANTTIRSNKVTVSDYLRAGAIDVENGGRLHVANTSDFHTSGRLELKQKSEFILEGSANLARVELAGDSSLVISGSLTTGQLEAEDSLVVVHDTGEPVSVERRFKLGGDSELRLVIGDEEWGATFELAARRAKPRLSGVMQLELAPDFDPKLLQGKTIKVFDWGDDSPLTTEFAQVVYPIRLQLDLTKLYTDGEISVTSVLDRPKNAGDFNGDSRLDGFDIDSLLSRIHVGSADGYFDLNVDEQVTFSDLVVLVEGLIGTDFGDVDLNGEVDFLDFLQLADHFGQEGGWGEGDFDGDGRIEFPDFLALAANFSGESAAAVSAVPEPTGVCLAMFAIVGLVGFRRRR